MDQLNEVDVYTVSGGDKRIKQVALGGRIGSP